MAGKRFCGSSACLTPTETAVFVRVPHQRGALPTRLTAGSDKAQSRSCKALGGTEDGRETKATLPPALKWTRVPSSECATASRDGTTAGVIATLTSTPPACAQRNSRNSAQARSASAAERVCPGQRARTSREIVSSAEAGPARRTQTVLPSGSRSRASGSHREFAASVSTLAAASAPAVVNFKVRREAGEGKTLKVTSASAP